MFRLVLEIVKNAFTVRRPVEEALEDITALFYDEERYMQSLTISGSNNLLQHSMGLHVDSSTQTASFTSKSSHNTSRFSGSQRAV